ncbi:NlpC/P60 family protein [Neobacillus muris]|uniref:C40 family peptidase n=1 Tax=Neobacillus muris TaxID=2941334 RepID=UPI002407CD16|nr:C40 family peptidase [Neobacillus muris]
MIRKLVVLLCAFILVTSELPFLSSLAHAEEIETSQEQKYLNSPADIHKNQTVNTLDAINSQLALLNQAIEEQNKKIAAASLEVETLHSEMLQLQNEIAGLQAKIDKRKSLVKERALTYQQSGANVSYLNALLLADSISDLVNRVDAVAKIIKADQDLLSQQDADLKDLENKKAVLAFKQGEAAAKAAEWQNLQIQLTDQQNHYVSLTQHLEKEVEKQETKKQEKIETQDYIHIVTTVGQKYIGQSRYAFGGGRTTEDIANGRFDCSGFVRWAFSQAGIDVGNSTSDIKNAGQKISASEMKPGDLVFFDTYKKDGHVGIYLGDGKFIGSQSSTGVAIADMTAGYWKNKFSGTVVRI